MTYAAAHPTVTAKPAERRNWWPDLAAAGVLLLLWAAVWMPRLRGPIDLRWDASAYYILGTSLAEGKGYRLLNEPGTVEAIQYPPLLPVMIAAEQLASGPVDYLTHAARLRMLYCALSAFYLAAVYVLARGYLSAQYALIVAILTGLSFSAFLHPSDTLYAELPFALLTMLFLAYFSREPGVSPEAAGLAWAAYLLRTAGVALLAAWVAESLVRRRMSEAAARALIAAVPLLLWQGYVARVTRSEAYRHPAYEYQRAPYYYSNVSYAENAGLRDPFRPELGRYSRDELAARVGRNVLAVPEALAQSAWIASTSFDWFREKVRSRTGLPLPPTAVLRWTLVLLGCVMVAGAVRFARMGIWLPPLYFGATIGMICLTPWPGQFWRYLAPLAPVSLLFLVTALLAGGRRLVTNGASAVRTLGSAVVALPLAGMLLFGATVAGEFLRHCPIVTVRQPSGGALTYRPLIYPADWPPLDDAFEWVRAHAAPQAVVASAVPHLSFLRTGHPSVLIPMEARPDSTLALLDQVPVSYVVLDGFDEPAISRRYGAPAMESRPDRWRLAFTAPGGRARVFERSRR